MSKSKRVLSFIMAFAMVLSIFSGVGAAFVPKASATDVDGHTGSESVIKPINELNALGKDYVYFGMEFYEKNLAGDWEITDHYVNPGDTLRAEFYMKSTLWFGAGSIYLTFDRNFFDITNGAALTYKSSYDPAYTGYPTEGYPANLTGDVNTSHPGVAANGVTFTYATKWARNTPGFTEKAQTNFHNIPLAETDEWDLWYISMKRDGSGKDATAFDSDEYFFSFEVTVREFMPDGTTKLADGTTGFVTVDKRVYSITDQGATTKRVGYVSTIQAGGQNSAAKRMHQQTDYTIDEFFVEDCNHVFTIGQNPDNMPSFGESVVDSIDDLNALGKHYVYFGMDFYEIDPTTGDWNYTDHYVNPGDKLRAEFYMKSTLWFGAGSIYLTFDRNFFDITNGAELTYKSSYDPAYTGYPTEGYPANLTGDVNTNHPGVAANGVTFTYATKWARNTPGFTEKAQTNFHNIPLAETDEWDLWYISMKRDGSGKEATAFDSDEYFFSFEVTVREFMPDGTTKLADGTTGFVTVDKRVYSITDQGSTTKRVGYVSTIQAGGQNSAAKRMHQQTDYTINEFFVEDCNHTFTIGKPSAGGKEYTATFEVDGAPHGDAVTAKKGDAINAPADPVKAGYSFDGWALKGTETILEFPQTMGEADVTYVAIFTALPKYTATFYADGVMVGEAKEYYEGDVIEAPVAPTKIGYTFSNWEPEVGVMPSSNVVFNAVYTAKTYTATWTVDGASIGTTTATYDAAYVLPTQPSKDGYTFAGWYADANFTTEIADAHTVESNVTFYAKFTANVYTITFNTDGGSAIAPVEYAFGATVVAPAAPTKTGYTFAGWSPELPATMPANNVTVVAQWTAVASGVKFMDGDEVVKEITANYNEVITAAMVPAMSKDGFNFTGWIDANGNKVTFPQTLGTDVLVVYATWTAKSYYIEFYDDFSGDWLAGNNQTCGNAIVTPDVESHTGYAFVGWYDADGNPMPETVPAKEGQVYYAKFEAELYNAVFMNGDEVHTTVTGAYQSSIAAPVDPAKEGHTFQYWAKEGTTAKVNFPAKMPINGIKYVAIYKINTYTITYLVDGVEVFSEEYTYGADITPYEYKAAEGATFTGWDNVPAKMPANDVVVKGYTGVANYTVTFTINGEEYATETFAFNTAVTAPAYTIPEGHTFSGWDLPAAMPAQNITLDATLTLNSYWARWYLDEEMTILYHEEKVPFGAEITFPEDPTEADMPGRIFDFWENDHVTTMPVGGQDYFAWWIDIEYNVSFFNEDGTPIEDASWTAYYGDVITEEDAPVVTKEGFEFKGWLVNGEKVTLPYTVTGNVELTASFGIVSYDVIWVIDGKVVYTDSYDYNEAIVMRADAVKEGYTFSGWDKDLTGMAMPAEDITVTGTFTVNQYNAIFYADDVLLETVPTNFGEVPVAPEAPAKDGYAFVGWTPALAPMVVAEEGVRYDAIYSAGTVGYTVKIYTMDTEGVYGEPEVLYMSAETDAPISYAPAAKTGFTVADDSVLSGTANAYGTSELVVYYERNLYMFTTIIDNVKTEIEYYYDEALEAVDEPTKVGHKFIGWDNTIPAKMPARDVTVTARFQILQYTITFDTVGGSNIAAIRADYNTPVNKPADPTKVGYTFDGWDIVIPDTIPAEDITITAKWVINQYTITFVDTGDVAYEAIKQDYNSEIAAVADPVKTGYTFTGWDVTIPAKMPAKDMTITATWKVNEYPATFIIDGEAETVATAFDAMPVAPAAVKYGYTFIGWVAEDGAVYAADALPVMVVGGATYTAKFEANAYNATFDAGLGKWADGDNVKVVENVTFGTTVVAPAEDPEREGYIFVGWDPADLTMDKEDGKTFTAIWDQNLDYCTVQSVTRITADVYGPALAQYEIKVMGAPVKLQIAYADATDITWTFDRNDAKVAADNTAAGLVSITSYNVGTTDAYEIWTICTVLTEDNYKVRAKVNYSSTSWETLEFAYDYTMTYDEVPVAATMVYSADASAAVIKRGTTGTITVVADASVTRLQLKMKKADGSYSTVTFAPSSSAVACDKTSMAAENKYIWVITLTFTYSGTAESQTQNWEVWYRTSLTDWADSGKAVEVKVTRLAVETAEPAPGNAPYSVLSVAVDKTNVAVAEAVTVTIVTTNDITRVRLNNTATGKTATYLTTAKNNVVVTEDAEAGTYTWQITYRFGTAGADQQWYAQCRGTSWSALDKSFTVTVTE